MTFRSLLRMDSIKGKIICWFIGVVTISSVLIGFIGYLALSKAVNQEFRTRIHSDASTFKSETLFDLAVGDTDAITNRMQTRLSDADLVAMALFDLQNQEADNAVYAISENHNDGYDLSLEDLRKTVLETTRPSYVSSDVSAATKGKNLAELPALFTSNQSEALIEDVKIKGAGYLVYVTTAFEEGSETAASALYTVYSNKRIDSIRGNAFTSALTIILIACAAASVFGYFLGSYLTRPITNMIEVIKDIAEGDGDLTVRIRNNRTDEIGEMSKWFNLFVSKLNSMIGTMSKTCITLHNQLSHLNDNIGALGENVGKTDKAFHAVSDTGKSLRSGIASINTRARDSYQEMEKVAGGTSRVAENTSEMSASIQSTTDSLSQIAGAVEELSGTLQEMSRNMEHSNKTTNEAALMSKEAREKVRVLNEHARNINDFVGLIDGISKQTNLLALNATIEAASAGDMGRGFAVVANEIKELAKQTAQSVQQIAIRVQQIQESTHTTIEMINKISAVMEEASSINHVIVSTIEQQNLTVQEIHQNLDNTSQDSAAIAGAARESREVSKEIATFCQAAFQNTSGVMNVTQELSQHSDLLAEKSQVADAASLAMNAVLRDSTHNVNLLTKEADKLLAISEKFKYIEEDAGETVGS